MDMNRKYTWKKQKEDARDYTFEQFATLKKISTTGLPSTVNNRLFCSAVEDQGQLGSCTANAWAGLLQYNECKNGRGGKLYNDLSRLFIYYNERVIENSVNTDSGAELRDGATSIAKQGVCIEKEWPYNINKFTIKPTAKCYTDALPNIIHSYYSLDSTNSTTLLNNLKSCLAAGQCFVFGFEVYDYFESDQMANTGVLQLPQPSESDLGGHAVMAIGYNDSQQRFLIRNSWGKGWGLKGNLDGYFTMPYAYITNPKLASDFWTVIRDI